MPRTPDRFPGAIKEDEGIILGDGGVQPVTEGQVVNDGGDIFAFDSLGAFNIRSAGGITEPQHEALDTLAHCLVESHFQAVTRVGAQVTNVTAWTDVGMTTKIRESQVTYSGALPQQVVCIQYDGAGVETYRLTHTMAYTGVNLDSVSTVRTP